MSKPLWLQLTCAKDDAKRYGEEGTTLRRLWGMYVATHCFLESTQKYSLLKISIRPEIAILDKTLRLFS